MPTTDRDVPFVRRVRSVVMPTVLCALFAFSGCMATESQRGETFVYKNSILKTLLLLGIAVALLVFGIGIFRESIKSPKRRPKQRTANSRTRQKAAPPAPQGKKTGGILVGAGLALGGVLILLLGVPSSLLAHVSISEDKVEIRNSVLWFAKGTREIPFSSISGIEKDEQEVAARRGKRTKETLILSHGGTTEFIEMGTLEKAAYPKLVETFNAWKESGGNAGGEGDAALAETASDPENALANVTPNNPNATNPIMLDQTPIPVRPNLPAAQPFPELSGQPSGEEPDTQGLTPVGNIGRIFPGAVVSAPFEGGKSRAIVLEVYAQKKVKVKFTHGRPGEVALVNALDVIPSASSILVRGFGPGTPVDPNIPPAPGSILLAPWAGRWFEVKVLSSQGTRSTIEWVGERGRMNVATSLLRNPPPEGTKPYVGERFFPPESELTPVKRIASAAPGKTLYYPEVETTREVVVIQPYREGVVKVRDAKTGDEFFVFHVELQLTPPRP